MRVLRHVSVGLAVLPLFAASLMFAAVLHLNLPITRDVVRVQVSKVLLDVFEGDIELIEVRKLGLTEVEASARVLHHGREVAAVESLRARLSPLRSWRRLRSDGTLVIDSLAVTGGQVTLDASETGDLLIVDAFELSPEDEPTPSTAPSVVQGVIIASIEVRDFEVTRATDAGPLRAHVASASARLSASAATDIAVSSLSIDMHVPDAPFAIGVTTRAHVHVGDDVTVEAAALTSPVATRDLRHWLPGLRAGSDLRASVVARYDNGDWGAHGTVHLTGVAGDAVATVGARASDRLRGHVSVSLDGLNGAALHAQLPASSVALHAAGHLEVPGALADLNLEQLPDVVLADAAIEWPSGGDVAGNAIPAGRAQVTLQGGRLLVEVDASEAGLSTTATIEAQVRSLERMRFHLQGDVDFAEQTRFSSPVIGLASLHAEGELDLSERMGQANLTISGSQLSIPSENASASSLTSTITVDGSFDDPFVVLQAELHDVAARGFRYDRARLRTSGTLDRSDVNVALIGGSGEPASLNVSAVTSVDPLVGRVALTQVAADALLRGTTVSVRADRIVAGPDGVLANDLVVGGLGDGTSKIDLVVDAQGLRRMKLDAPRISTRTLAKLLGLTPWVDGDVSAQIDLLRGRTGLNGHANLVLAEGQLGDLKPVNAVLALRVEDNIFHGAMNVNTPAVGRVALELNDLAPDGDILSIAAWKRATGSARGTANVRMDHLPQLERAGLAIPAPLYRLAGSTTVNVELARTDGNEPPEVDVEVDVKKLSVVSRGQFLDLLDDDAVSRLARSFGQVDVRMNAKLGPDAEDVVELTARDAHGVLLALSGSAAIPYRALYQDDFAVLRTKPMTSWASSMALRVRAEMPPRAISALPALRAQGVLGTVGVAVDLDGTLADPRLALRIDGRRIRRGGFGRIPRNLVLDGSWQQRDARLKVMLSSPRGVPLLRAHLLAEASLKDLITEPGPPDWTASGHVEICRLPLAPLNRLLDAQVRGWITGAANFEGLNTDELRYELDLAANSLSVGGTPIAALTANANGDATSVRAATHVEDSDGKLDLSLTLPLERDGLRLSPVLERTSARLVAKNFKLGAIQPLTENIFDELDGRLDADVKLRAGTTTTITGFAKLREGRFQVASFGDTFFDTRAEVQFDNGLVRLKSFEAKTFGGALSARGELTTKGLMPQRATGRVDIDSQRAIPLIVFGQHFGDAHGTVLLDARLSDGGLHADVSLSDFVVELSQTLPTTVQDLEPSEHIRIGTRRGDEFLRIPLSPPDDAPRSADALPIRIDLALGDGVRVRRGNTIDALITGAPSVEVTDRTRMRGRLRLADGELFLQGKQFEVVRGVITFDGRPPDNPMVVATAAWDAPDGTRVFADFAGPVKTGNVTLRSNPALGRDAILSLILFGRADADIATTTGSNGGDRAADAAGVGGGVLTEGLNAAIGDLTDVDLSTRVATSRVGNPSAQVELQIARELSFVYSYILGLPPPGQNPDKNYGTIEWRFRRNWTAETSVGDQGSTSVDLRWEKRY